MDQIFILVLFVLMVAAVAYAFNRRDDEVASGDEVPDVPSPSTPPEESNASPAEKPQDQKARKAPVKSAKKPSKKVAKKTAKKPRNRREL